MARAHRSNRLIDRPAAVAREKIENDADTADGVGGWSG